MSDSGSTLLQLHPQRPYFQCRSGPEEPRVRTSACGLTAGRGDGVWRVTRPAEPGPWAWVLRVPLVSVHPLEAAVREQSVPPLEGGALDPEAWQREGGPGHPQSSHRSGGGPAHPTWGQGAASHLHTPCPLTESRANTRWWLPGPRFGVVCHKA